MNHKKKIPWSSLYSVLILLQAGAYFVSGLFSFPDVTMLNYEEKLVHIILHPFHPWWNEKTPMVMGIAFILWLMGVSYFLTYYRNYHFNAEHGTASWAEVKEVSKRLADPNPMRNTIAYGVVQRPVLRSKTA